MTPYSSTTSSNFQKWQWLLSQGLLSLSFLCLTATANGQGQRSLAAQAAQLCQDRAWSEALEMSAKALADPNENAAAYTWYVHGFVCKEIYKAQEAHLRQSAMRLKAIDAFLTAEHKQGQAEISTHAPLRYLITTLHNDALLCAGDFTSINEWEPDSLFQQYKRLAEHTAVHTNTELALSEAQFLKVKAQHYFDLWSSEMAVDYNNAMAIKYYSLALEKTPDDCLAVYNIGVAYYDQAVLQSEIEGVELCDLTRLQIAHTYFTKANALCANDAMVQAAYQLTRACGEQHKIENHKKLDIKKR